MATIMRSDQTLRLVQLYHDNYPEISKHTQDIEGRRRKMEIWKSITDELNLGFDTQFTVEQYKKKLQNVQCTSRQKLQTGKRPTDNTTHKFSPAEREFIRLFESGTRDSSPSSLLNGIKVEDLIQQFGAAVNSHDHCSSSNSRTPTPADLSNNENTGFPSMINGQDILNQQLLLLLNNSHLLPNLTAIASGNHSGIQDEEEEDGGEGEPPQQASPAATSSSSSDFGGIKKVEESKIPVSSTSTATATTATGSAKRKKRKLEIISSPESHLRSSSSEEFMGDSSTKFASEMVKLQKQILANQEKILQELRLQRPTKNARMETELGTLLGAKLDRLCDCLLEVVNGNSLQKRIIDISDSSSVSTTDIQ